MFVARTNSTHVCLGLTFAFLAACGGSQGGANTAAGSDGEVSCPAPIGTIARENCADVSADFGALNVEGALKTASSSKGADERIEAIHAAGDLATRLKERRVEVCTQYNACKMSLADHNAEDERITGLMSELIKVWDERKFNESDGPSRLRDQVKAIATKFDGQSSDVGAPVSDSKPTSNRVLGDKLSQVTGAGVSFSSASGAITASATGDGPRDVLRAGTNDLHASGGRYVLRVMGNYAPAAAPLIKAGDDLTVRFKYRAAQPGDVYVALRSLEDPEAAESTSTLTIAKAGAGDQQTTLTAAPGSSGFYVAIGSRNIAIDVDDVEVLRGGSVIASALAESSKEAQVETTCSIGNTKAITGKGSFVCPSGTADAIVVGRPRSHLFITVRSASGEERALLRTMSLEGGRSIDAKIGDDSTFVIGLVGPGSATIQAVEVKKL